MSLLVRSSAKGLQNTEITAWTPHNVLLVNYFLRNETKLIYYYLIDTIN
jgi:hypothetical protein